MKPIVKEIIEFSILKEIAYNNTIPTPKNYNIDESTYVSLFKDMLNKHYINPKRVLFNILGDVEIENEIDLVTSLGNQYIESQEGWNKMYNNLSDLNKLLDVEVKND